MKKFLATHKWKIIGILGVFIVGIPAIINWLFKLHAPCSFLVAEWSAGNVLAFYGTLLASVATIVGVYLSIDYAQKNYREDEANRVRPYLALTHYKSKSKCKIFSTVLDSANSESYKDPEEYYKEYKLDKVFIIIGSEGILFKDGLTDAQQEALKSGGLGWRNDGGMHYTLRPLNIVSMPFEIENVGTGACLNTMIVFYKKGSARRGINVFTIKSGESAYCHIFSDEQNSSLYGEYILEFIYSDILGNCYSQKYDVEFGINPEGGKFFSSINLQAEQKRES